MALLAPCWASLLRTGLLRTRRPGPDGLANRTGTGRSTAPQHDADTEASISGSGESMKLRRIREVCAIAFGGLAIAATIAGPARSQEWPSRPLTMIAPF